MTKQQAADNAALPVYEGPTIRRRVPPSGPTEHCAKCGKPVGKLPWVSVAKDGGVWNYCSERCQENH